MRTGGFPAPSAVRLRSIPSSPPSVREPDIGAVIAKMYGGELGTSSGSPLR